LCRYAVFKVRPPPGSETGYRVRSEVSERRPHGPTSSEVPQNRSARCPGGIPPRSRTR